MAHFNLTIADLHSDPQTKYSGSRDLSGPYLMGLTRESGMTRSRADHDLFKIRSISKFRSPREAK